MNTAHAGAALAFLLAAVPASAQNVKITPVGSHPGELCANDRATIFEDPTGVRILYDAGQTVTGGDDARLGAIHVVLLSHAHGDHIGDQKLKAVGAGECANSERLPALPNSTTAEIAAAKNAAIVMTSDMGTFIGRKVQNISGKPVAVCPQTAGVTSVPVAAPCRSNTHLGGAFVAKTPGAAQGVEITIVFASHANNVPLALLSEAQRANLGAEGTGIVLGPPTGYVVKFTNGLVAYLSGDTGIHTEMKTVVNEFHKANLAVLNLGTSAGTVMSAAYAMNELVRPASVILTHVNEAATEGGKLRAASGTAALIKQLKPTPHLAISGRTMEFDGKGEVRRDMLNRDVDRASRVQVHVPSKPLARWLPGLGVAALLMAGAASAADVHVMISAGFYGVYSELGPAFERASGHRLVTTRGPSMGDSPEAIPARLARGESADAVILDGGAADELGRRGLLRADSKVELARSMIGMVVRAGTAKPDIGSVEAFRNTLLAAKSVAYSDSGSGTYLSTTLFPKLGIADQVAGKSRKVRGPPSGEPVAAVVARGEAEIGFQQLSELIHVPGVTFVGSIPAELQPGFSFAGALTSTTRQPEAAGALIRFLASPGAAPTILKAGLTPLSGR